MYVHKINNGEGKVVYTTFDDVINDVDVIMMSSSLCVWKVNTANPSTIPV